MIFANRIEAAEKLAEELFPLKLSHPLVLGLPRGAVPIAEVVARRLAGELGVVLVRKIPAPLCAELAIAAIGESGRLYGTKKNYESYATPDYMRVESQRQLLRIRQMRHELAFGSEKISFAGRDVIVIDDGVATGLSMLAAIGEIKRKNPAQIIMAVPVVAPDSLELLRAEVDHVIALHVPAQLRAVGNYYHDFSQVSDDEVREIFLRKAHKSAWKNI